MIATHSVAEVQMAPLSAPFTFKSCVDYVKRKKSAKPHPRIKNYFVETQMVIDVGAVV